MFGSKIRSWMETHIVRPRKKGNKNKTSNSHSLGVSNGTQNGNKGNSFNTYQNDVASTNTFGTTNSISSPARRSEVSPIQSHTASRFGWQSPKRETSSPLSNNLSNIPSVKVHTLTSSAHVTPTNTAAVSSSLTNSPTISKSTKISSPANMIRKSSLSFAEENDNQSIQSPIHSKSQITTKQQSFPKNSSKSNDFAINSNYYKKLNSTKKVQSDSKSHNNNKITYFNVKQSDDTETKDRFQNEDFGNIPENSYGKLLPSKKINPDNISSPLGSYDNNINANIQIHIPKDGESKSINNNNITSSNIISGSFGSGPLYYQHHYYHIAGQVQCRNALENNRNVLRSNRYNSNAVLGGPSNHALVHVINSLSSPESAYSTGYSTDGTSPDKIPTYKMRGDKDLPPKNLNITTLQSTSPSGATYAPPEYYINMRTGTHYFPKNINALSIEATRYKFGLNKIEEISPQEPLPNNHRRTESFDLGKYKPQELGSGDPACYQMKNAHCPTSSVIPQGSNVLCSLKGFESPSPRQRCRIRTNPWYSTAENSSNSTFGSKIKEIDASSSSSGIKSNSDAGISDKNEYLIQSKSKCSFRNTSNFRKNVESSDSDSASSSTEVEAMQPLISPGTIRRKKVLTESINAEPFVEHLNHQDSDEDATLNEMMGKFDESYVYEKETDILSDSDPTDCPSDLDTGQDAEDECDTDDFLDIDFIDKGSIQEIVEKESYKNTGSCSYFNYQLERRTSKFRRTRKIIEDACTSKRKKRLLKTRKKSVENKEKYGSPVPKSRESRSLGGTPVSLRRNQTSDMKETVNPLSNRSNSLTLTEFNAIQGRFITIAESEKALLKADLEANVKYKQLIHEAETILVSMKGNAIRETPVASPRRIYTPPANKRVEMLRNYEADIKREMKQQKGFDLYDNTTNAVMDNCVLINKRLEIIKQETNSVPSSPKCGRISPRKTHVTNFINQNVGSTEPVRRESHSENNCKTPHSQSVEKRIKSPCISPSYRRRLRSQSPKVFIYSESDSENDLSRKSSSRKGACKREQDCKYNVHTNIEINDTVHKKIKQTRQAPSDSNEGNITEELCKLGLHEDNSNLNTYGAKKPPLMSFRSIDVGNSASMHTYCPQSEPLKRKIYKGSSSFERIKKSLELESELPKQALLDKISNLRRERQTQKISSIDVSLSANSLKDYKTEGDSCSSNICVKRQLIFHTIEDLKRSLEDQSVELCGLNDQTHE